MVNHLPLRPSPWPHRLAVALALVTFPLIWVGGLVTTYDAGMAVPDWPGTYGYNLLLYPWQSWLAAPWDLFIEHGHRLLGAAAGLLSIVLLATVYFADRRPWMVQLAAGALVLVILQGVLGGARVVFDERLVALIHACVGPLYFAYLAGLVVVTSRWWAEQPAGDIAAATSLVRAVWLTTGLACAQLLLGALLRHVPLAASPNLFRVALLLHLFVAAALTVQISLTVWKAWSARAGTGLALPATAIAVLLALQVLLGIGTYVAKYSWPAWLGDYQFAAAYVVQEKSLWQSLITTAHVANGSLILFIAVFMAMRVTHPFFCRAAGNLDLQPAAATGLMPASLGRSPA